MRKPCCPRCSCRAAPSPRVTFSVGATACDFDTGACGVTVNDWSLEYGPVG